MPFNLFNLSVRNFFFKWTRFSRSFTRRTYRRLPRPREFPTNTLSSSKGSVWVDLEICGSSDMSPLSQYQALFNEVSHCGFHNSKLELIRHLCDAHVSVEHYAAALEQKYQNLKEQHQKAEKGFCLKLLDAGRVIRELKLEVSGLVTSVRVLPKDPQQKHDEIRTVNNTIQPLKSKVLELQSISQEHHPGLESKVSQSEGHIRSNATTGAYNDEFAIPSLLGNALSITKTSVTRFQRDFVEAMRSSNDPASIVDLFCPDAFFARHSHVNYANKGAVYEILFEGFENESFNTNSGVSKHLDPNLRQQKFYQYYGRHQDGTSEIEDPLFGEYCEMKFSSLLKKFNLRRRCVDDKCMHVSCLAAGGGERLLSSFRVAARRVWLLHKLAFSFEPPASIFRIETGVDIDPNYMSSVVSLEDDKRFVPKVGFMISPGFRLGNTVLRSDVYLSGASGRVDFDNDS